MDTGTVSTVDIDMDSGMGTIVGCEPDIVQGTGQDAPRLQAMFTGTEPVAFVQPG